MRCQTRKRFYRFLPTGTFKTVTVSTAPRTIHDFGVFPRELYQVQLGGFIRNKSA